MIWINAASRESANARGRFADRGPGPEPGLDTIDRVTRRNLATSPCNSGLIPPDGQAVDA
jgi:hypothetical protein